MPKALENVLACAAVALILNGAYLLLPFSNEGWARALVVVNAILVVFAVYVLFVMKGGGVD